MRWRMTIAMIVLVTTVSRGQQLPVYSAFNHNPYLINPAVTAYDMYMDISLHAKKQWLGFEHGPFNQTLTTHSSINEMNFGFGGGFFNDNLGVIKHQGFFTSFGYHLPVGEDAKLGFGVTGRFSFYGLDQDKMALADPQDALINANLRSGLVPDLSVGMLLHRGDYMIGVSAQNLLASAALFDPAYSLRDIQHYNFHASWKIYFNDMFAMTPSTYVSYIPTFPIFVDTRFSFQYDERFDFEIGYKSSMDIVIGLGAELVEDLRLYYNYDLVLSGLRVGTSGSHEILLSYDFYYNPAYKGSRRRYKWIRKGRKKKSKMETIDGTI